MKKKFLKITGIIVLVISLGGLWGYNKYFKPNPVIQKELNNQFGTDFFNSFDPQNVGNNSSNGSANKATGAANNIPGTGVINNSGAVNNGKVDGSEEKSNSQSAASTPGNETNAAQGITQEEITNKYMPKFTYLQNVALNRLDTLYSAAIQEYEQGKKAGTLNRSQLAQKYLQAGTMLEASVDNQFNSTLNAMQAELTANNFPTDIIGVTKSEYEKAKSAKRTQLLAKVHL